MYSELRQIKVRPKNLKFFLVTSSSFLHLLLFIYKNHLCQSITIINLIKYSNYIHLIYYRITSLVSHSITIIRVDHHHCYIIFFNFVLTSLNNGTKLVAACHAVIDIWLSFFFFFGFCIIQRSPHTFFMHFLFFRFVLDVVVKIHLAQSVVALRHDC